MEYKRIVKIRLWQTRKKVEKKSLGMGEKKRRGGVRNVIMRVRHDYTDLDEAKFWI